MWHTLFYVLYSEKTWTLGQSEHLRGPSLDIGNYSFKRLCYISLRTIVSQPITSLVVVDEFCVTHTTIAQISISYINKGSLFIKLEKQASSNLAISWWLTKNYNYTYLLTVNILSQIFKV